MDWLATILTSPNALIVIGGLIVLVLLLAWLSNKGVFSLNRWGLTIGNLAANQEQAIIRTQIQWCEADCEDLFNSIVSTSNIIDMYKAKYTIEKILDELVKIVVFNHITEEPIYIKLKQDLIWGTVSSINPEGSWNILEGLIRDRVKKSIKALYEIRQYYTNKEAK